MTKYPITKLEKTSDILKAATFFSQKWNVPTEAYIESMKDSLVSKSGVPAWFYIELQNEIIAGLGIIENDFHKRKDLTPNICAVYVVADAAGGAHADDVFHAVEVEQFRGIDADGRHAHAAGHDGDALAVVIAGIALNAAGVVDQHSVGEVVFGNEF